MPAVISYIALFYIVHLEAMKMNLRGLPKRRRTLTLASKLMGVLAGFIGMAVLGMAVYYGLGWIKVALPRPDLQHVAIVIFLAFYLLLLSLRGADARSGSRRPGSADHRAAAGGRHGDDRALLLPADRHPDLVHPDRTFLANGTSRPSGPPWR